MRSEKHGVCYWQAAARRTSHSLVINKGCCVKERATAKLELCADAQSSSGSWLTNSEKGIFRIRPVLFLIRPFAYSARSYARLTTACR